MRKMKLILKGILLFALITCSVNAAPLKWEVDPAHSGFVKSNPFLSRQAMP